MEIKNVNSEITPNNISNPTTLEAEVSLTKQQIEDFKNLSKGKQEEKAKENFNKFKELSEKLRETIQGAIKNGKEGDLEKIENIKKELESLKKDYEERKNIIENIPRKDEAILIFKKLESFVSFNIFKRLLKKRVSKDQIVRGLVGIGTPESIKMRERLIKEGAGKDWIIRGLAGVATPEAMEMRERLIKEGAENFDTYAESFGSRDRCSTDAIACRYGYEK